ncbi:MAG: glutamine--fructose-6-phosphate transaminase (isomerizing) [Acidobacteria bacterium]|nr:MAG: glutamine--fructose-6-phosphate transaminase (isomerizing) [Acidobacteriota bacterium]
MCGIIGYLGPKPVVPVLLDGLRRLEYRGYDSAGIALVRDGHVEVRRSAGKLSCLVESVNAHPLHGDYGIGHTRWATHGKATADNAHPHRDCSGRIVVVHNGIIENYLELKHRLQAAGHRFTTETDTEVVAHLVEQEWNGDGLEGAVRRALRSIRGVFGLVFVCADDPGKIVAVREGPPIVVGIGDGEFLVASDIPPILRYTRDIVALEDGEMAVLRRRTVEFFDRDGQRLNKQSQRVQWDASSVQKGSYRHFMLKEIFEQPLAIRQTLGGHESHTSGVAALAEVGLSKARLQETRRLQIVACGTSWHAGLVGKFLIEQLARIPVEVDYASEYRYRDPILDKGTLAVAITQSGETADTLAALREARGRGAATLAICNVVGSLATREAEGTFHTHAGPEIGVASTKAFTAQLVALYLLALRLAEARQALSCDEIRQHLDGLKRLPELIERTLECDRDVQQVARRHYQKANALYLGRGSMYPIALEGALKLKEVSYIHAEGYPAGEMKHGPIALINEDLPVIALVTDDRLFDKVAGNVQESKARGASVVLVTDACVDRFSGVLDPARDAIIRVPAAGPFLLPVVMAVPLQLLAYHVAVYRGCDVDQPRNLAKSVTVE